MRRLLVLQAQPLSLIDIDSQEWTIVRRWKFLESLAERWHAKLFYRGPAASIWELRHAIHAALLQGDAAWLMNVADAKNLLLTKTTVEDVENLAAMDLSEE